MPSETRKLPVLYASTIDIFDVEEYGNNLVYCVSDEPPQTHFAKYIPDVPRCETCRLFFAPCNTCDLGFGESRNTTPDDYCSHHSDLTK